MMEEAKNEVDFLEVGQTLDVAVLMDGQQVLHVRLWNPGRERGDDAVYEVLRPVRKEFLGTATESIQSLVLKAFQALSSGGAE
jgi:hypothetical protein